LLEQKRVDKELVSLGEGSHWFIYRDDPYKILYKTESGEVRWVRFASTAFASANFSREENEQLRKLRAVYDLDRQGARPEDLMPDLVKIVPALGKFWNSDGKENDETGPISESIDGLRAKVISLMKQKRLTQADLGNAPLDQIPKEELIRIIENARPPQTVESTKSLPAATGIPPARKPVADKESTYAEIVGNKWKQSEIELIRRMVARDANDDEFKVFLYVAYTSGLDPLKKQIWFWKQSGETIIMSSIHGKLSKAMESGMFDGYDTMPVLEDGKLVAYDAIGWRKDMSHPIKVRAYLGEYIKYKKDGTVTEMWESKPYMMLEKCALSLLLSRMFPDKLGGIYSAEEIEAEEQQNVSPAPSGVAGA
jgi:phage recombination protein Bet